MTSKPLPAEQQNVVREQTIINTRILALKHARTIILSPGYTGILGADNMITEASKIEEYLLKGIDTVKPKSGLVIQTQMPPPGEFKPGK